MMEVPTPIYNRCVMYYPVDLTVIEHISMDLSNTMKGLAQPWHEMKASTIADIIRTALKVNFILNHRDQLFVDRKHVPDLTKIDIIQKALLVPRFVRDMIREILRPMHHAGITYLPDISITMEVTPYVLDSFYIIAEHLTRWVNTCTKLGYEMVSLLPEATQSVSLTFYSYETDELLAFDDLTCLDWRLEAFGRTKHLVHNPSSEVEDTGKTLPAASRKKAQEKIEDDVEEKRVYERPIKNRRILGMLVYRYNCVKYNHILGYIPSSHRFPTEEIHSRTPPRSNRVSETDFSMMRTQERVARKPKKVRTVRRGEDTCE